MRISDWSSDVCSSDLTGPFFVGQGVETSAIERIFSQFLVDGLRSATSGESRLSAFDEIATRFDNLLADRSIGLQPALSGFFASVQDLANNPSDTAARTALLGQANDLRSEEHTSELQSLMGI